MLRATVIGINVTGRICNQLTFNVSNNPLSVQSVRWRKPLYLGTAKSKMFIVPPRRREDPEDRAELFRLNKNYKTSMRSLRAFFREETLLREQKLAAVSASDEDDREFEKMKAMADAWNAEIAKTREVRLAKLREERETYILSQLDEKREMDKMARQRADEIIRKEMEAAKTYIRPENLDAAIEYALSHPIDFRFAIDLQGEPCNHKGSGGQKLLVDEEADQ